MNWSGDATNGQQSNIGHLALGIPMGKAGREANPLVGFNDVCGQMAIVSININGPGISGDDAVLDQTMRQIPVTENDQGLRCNVG